MNKQFGGVNYVFKGPMYQKGYGLGGYFRNFMKWMVPIAEKHILPHLKTWIKTIGQEALSTTNNIF